MENQNLVSKFEKLMRISYFICLLFFLGLFIGCLYNYDKKDITTTFYLFGSIFFFAFVYKISKEIYETPTIIVNKDYVELIRVFKTKPEIIDFHNIKSWLIRKKKSKNGEYEILYLVLYDFRKLKIKSYFYSNFQEIVQALTQNKPKDIELEKELDLKEKKLTSIVIIVIGLICLLLTAYSYDIKQLSNNDISIVKGHLSEPIKIEKNDKSNVLWIRLIEFPEFKFRICSTALKVTNYIDLINDFNKGQEIIFAVEKKEYDKKITKKIESTFWELVFHYDKIHVVEINDNDLEYLSLEDYNREHNRNYKLFTKIFGVLGILLTIGGIVMYFRRRK